MLLFIQSLAASLYKPTPVVALNKGAEPKEKTELVFDNPKKSNKIPQDIFLGEELPRSSRQQSTEEPKADEKIANLPLFADTNLAETVYLSRLQNRDASVRAHEQSHLAAVDGYARGGPHYNYIMGPDGRLYAVSGSIDVDLSPIPGNPEATIRKARIIRRASLSPLEPSGQDLRIAAQAYRMEIEAQRELARQNQEKNLSPLQNNAQKPVDVYA